MKYLAYMISVSLIIVAPYAGAWIEIRIESAYLFNAFVAPYAGAWIEICRIANTISSFISRSLRGSVD